MFESTARRRLRYCNRIEDYFDPIAQFIQNRHYSNEENQFSLHMNVAKNNSRLKGDQMSAIEKKGSIEDQLAKNHLCYVLLTCNNKKNGKMEFKMTCQGDRVIASYMLENAQNIIDEDSFTE